MLFKLDPVEPFVVYASFVRPIIVIYVLNYAGLSINLSVKLLKICFV